MSPLGVVILALSALLFLGGLFTFLCGCLKPGFFFRHPDVARQVVARGVAGAGRFYCNLGLYCMGFSTVCVVGWLLVAMADNQWTLLLALSLGLVLIMALRGLGQRMNKHQ